MNDSHLSNYKPRKRGRSGAMTSKVAEVLRHRDRGRDAGTICGWTGLRLSVVKQILADNPVTKTG